MAIFKGTLVSLFKKFMLALVVGTFLIGLGACPEQEGPAERTGEEVDETMEEGGEAMEEAGEEVD
ncbi:MAG TPA: hypothetical protein VHT73_01615 [Thermodesulfobacteriota bacterium]|nr:hypothetical protein [Thermodesulfobacteriota bacterium]